MKNTKETREQWLQDAIRILDRDLFKPQKVALPEKLRISVGFPAGGRRGKGVHRIGECWSPQCSADKHTEIFIHPEVSDPVNVLAITVHELVHAAGHWDHKAGFKKLAMALGLEGKMTATVPGEELTTTLKGIVKGLPVFPHGSLNHQDGQTTAPKKQGTRMLALTCPGCGYKVRTSQKWIDIALPQCGSCGLDLEPEAEGGGE